MNNLEGREQTNIYVLKKNVKEAIFQIVSS